MLVADALSELEPQNILMPPRQVVELSDLLEAGESEQHALELYERMCDAVGELHSLLPACMSESLLVRQQDEGTCTIVPAGSNAWE